MNYATLPNLIALFILVAVFWAISRRATAERLHLWLVGWILILLHFVAQFVTAGEGAWSRVATTINLDCLALAGVAFLVSCSLIALDQRRQLLLGIAIAAPALSYVNGVIWGIADPDFYYFLIAIGAAAPLMVFWRYSRRGHSYGVIVTAAVVLMAAVTAWIVARGAGALGITVILASLNLVAAILYWNRYRRPTAGVLTAVLGFAAWGAVFPTSILISIFLKSVKVDSEVWNIPKYLVALGMILTLLEDQMEKSQYLAYHDELTGLPNRRLLEDRMEQALASARRARTRVAVLLLDLDHFKEVNDNFGHRLGDEALKGVVTRLANRIRASDTLARSGGDEFTVISSVNDLSGAEVLAQDLELALSTPIEVGDARVQIGLSVGIALYPEDGDTADELHAAADRAMYAAKRSRSRAVASLAPEAPA
ncbi:MAG TPA: GGDEF domain-containing protein [Candidatus Binatia bacterium]|nr:GGDEF domain-containing protein [Candidatus Binatia bacterium]